MLFLLFHLVTFTVKYNRCQGSGNFELINKKQSHYGKKKIHQFNSCWSGSADDRTHGKFR